MQVKSRTEAKKNENFRKQFFLEIICRFLDSERRLKLKLLQDVKSQISEPILAFFLGAIFERKKIAPFICRPPSGGQRSHA